MQTEPQKTRISKKKDLVECCDFDPTQRAWIEVSGSAIENNVQQIKSILKPDCKFMAVVKADGYGHDAIFVSEYAIRGGADALGVATLREGINLRKSGIKIPILVLGNIFDQKDLSICFNYHLMPTVSSLSDCLICNNIGKKNLKKFPIHLKIDTGMSRLGFRINDFIENFNTIKLLEYIKVDGIYSHLATADEDNALKEGSFTQNQKIKFESILKEIKIDDNSEIITHLSNSAGTLLGEDFHFDMVRVGLSMYGYNPVLYWKKDIKLRPALALKSKVSFIREIDKDIGVSYGMKFITQRRTKLAVVSIGYADGINRKLSNQINLMFKSKYFPQVGNITMDQLMIDITDSDEIFEGSTVVLLGSEGGNSITPIEWANTCESIVWEILCAFKNRLPRVLTC